MRSVACARLFWIGVFAAIAVVGLPRVGQSDPHLPLIDHGAESSVNAVLTSTLKAPELAVPLDDWLKTLPKKEPILVVAQPGNTSALFVADMISYLAWPGRVEIAWAKDPSELHLPQSVDSYCAVGWVRLPAPPAPYVKSFGPTLTFISTRPWK